MGGTGDKGRERKERGEERERRGKGGGCVPRNKDLTQHHCV